MSLPMHQSQDESQWFDVREFDRGAVEIYADVREHGGGKLKVHIIDLSQSGFRIRSSTFIRDDRAIFLTIPGYAALAANIMWHDRDLYGCSFVNPLHQAIYDHMIRNFPSLAMVR
jgi:hypothetical protein